jgi:hypothetical protein
LLKIILLSLLLIIKEFSKVLKLLLVIIVSRLTKVNVLKVLDSLNILQGILKSCAFYNMLTLSLTKGRITIAYLLIAKELVNK